MFSCFLDTIDFKINHKFNNIKKKNPEHYNNTVIMKCTFFNFKSIFQ